MQTTITGKHDDPWLNPWLKALQPRKEYFTHESSIHGTAHVARVLIHAWIIGKRHRPEITQELLAAAFIHDLSRRHDGTCHVHGEMAVEEQLPKWRKLLGDMGAKDFALVADMVARHCRMPADDDSLAVRLFRNADGLDRVRLGDLDPNMLYDKSPELLDVAWTLFEAETDNLLRLFKFAPDSI